MKYIYNTSGDYVAFIQGNNLFSPSCDWWGFIRNGNEVYRSSDGSFLGEVSADDRIIRNTSMPEPFKQFIPFKPFKPFEPFKPFNRFKMYKLMRPWEDVFEKTSKI